MSDITFSVDYGNVSDKEAQIVRLLAEEYFKTEGDSEQAKVNDENRNWIHENIPECRNVIKDGEKIVGFTLIFPCKKETMNLFLNNDITEEELLRIMKKELNYKNFDSIYLCSTVIIEEYRRKGLALKAFIKSIEKIISFSKNKKPNLFYWGFSEEGKRLSEKVAKETGLELKYRR
ncbi:MAG: hypothetical protein WCK29_02140 [archaeon]